MAAKQKTPGGSNIKRIRIHTYAYSERNMTQRRAKDSGCSCQQQQGKELCEEDRAKPTVTCRSLMADLQEQEVKEKGKRDKSQPRATGQQEE